jgi:hypothetical protein
LSASGTTWSPQTGRRCFMNAPDPVRPQIWPVTKPPSLLSLSSPRTCLLVHLQCGTSLGLAQLLNDWHALSPTLLPSLPNVGIPKARWPCEEPELPKCLHLLRCIQSVEPASRFALHFLSCSRNPGRVRSHGAPSASSIPQGTVSFINWTCEVI